MTTEQDLRAKERFAAVVEALLSDDDVTFGGPGRKGFGSSALTTNGKIFAMLSSSGCFVVKLPRQRVDAAVAAGVGERYDPGHGRLMKEWLSLGSASTEDWVALAQEAKAFVAAKR